MLSTIANSMDLRLCSATPAQCTIGRSVNPARDLDDFSRDVFGRFDLGGTMNEREMRKADRI